MQWNLKNCVSGHLIIYRLQPTTAGWYEQLMIITSATPAGVKIYNVTAATPATAK